MAYEAPEFTGSVSRVPEQLAPQGPTSFWPWLSFETACAVVVTGLMWLGPVAPLPFWLREASWVLTLIIVPAASILVPSVWRTPYRKRKLVWPGAPTVLACALLAIVSAAVGQESAPEEPMPWTQAEVVKVEHGRTDRCVLQKPDGRQISPELEEGSGCGSGVERGDTLHVRYDPRGKSEPYVPNKDAIAVSGYMIPLVAVPFVGFGTWGAVRLRRKYRELYGV